MQKNSITVNMRVQGVTINYYIMDYADLEVSFKTDMVTIKNFEQIYDLKRILSSYNAFKVTIEGLEPPKTKIKKKIKRKNK